MPETTYDAWMERGLDAMWQRGVLRQPHSRTRGESGGPAHRRGSGVIDLASNDYLGLSNHPSIIEATIASVRSWGASSSSSRLVTGTTTQHLACEGDLALWCGSPAALLFSSGYLANLGLLGAVGGPGTHIIGDAHMHASLHDGVKLSGSALTLVPHNDVAAFDTALRAATQPRKFIAVESIYSVLGDTAPLRELVALCETHDAMLIVDEAHGIGVAGGGRGVVHELGLAGHKRIIITATLSKALGSQGGAVLGSETLREFLVNRARTFMFDTALAPAHADAARAALRVLRDEPERVERIKHVAAAWREVFGLAPTPGQRGAVVSVPMPTPAAALAAQQQAREHYVAIGVFRPPSTPDHVSRLRLTANASLSDAHVARACEILRDINSTTAREAS